MIIISTLLFTVLLENREMCEGAVAEDSILLVRLLCCAQSQDERKLSWPGGIFLS